MEALPNLNRLLERIRPAVAEYLLKQEGEILQSVQVLHDIPRPFSSVAFLGIQTSRRYWKLVMKTAVHHPVNQALLDRENQAVVEFDILNILYPPFQKVEKCSVPRPLLVIPDLETYVMEFVEGNILVNEHRYTHYFSARDRFDALREDYFYLGRWLKQFQIITGIRNGDLKALLGVMERCEHRLSLIESLNDPRVPKDLRKGVTEFLQDQWSKLAGEKIMVSGCHGDFGPWNVIVGPGGITVVDFFGSTLEPLSVDLLKVLVYLYCDKKLLTNSPWRVEELKKRFLEGYGPLPDIPFPALVICEAMQRVVNLWGMISTPGKRVQCRIQANQCIKAHIAWLTDERRRLLWPS